MKNEKVNVALIGIRNWAFKHDTIASCILTFLMGMAIGGICMALDHLLV